MKHLSLLTLGCLFFVTNAEAASVRFFGTLTSTSNGVASGTYFTNGDSAIAWFDYVADGGAVTTVTGYNRTGIGGGNFLEGFLAEGSEQSGDPFTWQGLQYTGKGTSSSQTLTYTGGVSGVSAAISVSQIGSTASFLPTYSGEAVTLKLDLTATGTGQLPYSADSVASLDNLHKLFISSAVTGTVSVSYIDFGTGTTVLVDEANFTGFSSVPEPASWVTIGAFGAAFLAYRRRKAIA